MEFKCWLPGLVSSAKLEACRKDLRRRLVGKHLSGHDLTTNQGYELYLTLFPPMHVSAGVSGNKSLPRPYTLPLFLEIRGWGIRHFICINWRWDCMALEWGNRNKVFWKQVHVGMEASKTNQTRWEWYHNTFTPSLHLVPFCQLCTLQNSLHALSLFIHTEWTRYSALLTPQSYT